MEPIESKIALKLQTEYKLQKGAESKPKEVLEKYTIDWEHTDKPLKTFWNRRLGELFGYTEDLKRAVAKEKAKLIAKEEVRGIIKYPHAKTLEDREIKYAETLSKMSVPDMLKANKEILDRFEKENIRAKNLATYEEVKEKLFKVLGITRLSEKDQKKIAKWIRNEIKKVDKVINENDIRGLIEKQSIYFFREVADRLHVSKAKLAAEVLNTIEGEVNKYGEGTADAYVPINNLISTHLLPQFLKESKAARNFILEGKGNSPAPEEFKLFLSQQLQTTIEEYKAMSTEDPQHKLGEALDRFFNPES